MTRTKKPNPKTPVVVSRLHISAFQSGRHKGADDFATPPVLYQSLNQLFGPFDHDPCPLGGSGGLESQWGQNNYVNPPYSAIPAWIQKTLEQMQLGRRSVMLIPFRPQRRYWFSLVYPNASRIMVFENGVKFGDYVKYCPFPLAVVLFDPAQTPQQQPPNFIQIGGRYRAIQFGWRNS